MRIATLRSSCAVLLLLFHMQSLVDVAREEAERRQRLEEQGIVAKVIDGNTVGQARHGNVSTSTEPDSKQKESPSRSGSAKSRGSVQTYRSALQKLDRAIHQNEARLASMRTRLQAEKWANPKSGKSSNRTGTTDQQARLQSEMDDLQLKLKQLRDERFEVYEAGKKAGFMPGELEGRGIIP
jgi:predicted RNase H-like nuclease (RuvC/YqgF family)